MSSVEGAELRSNEEVMEVPEIPSAGMSSFKDTSSFSQVVFPAIPDYFPPGQNVLVPYVLTEALATSSRDWLGLFKVGWTSTREYVTYVWAQKDSIKGSGDRTINAEFQAYYLPKDNDEFYQFCYVTKQGQVRGASTPFQFRSPNSGDLVEMEDESGMVMLKTKSAVLEERLQKMVEQKEILEKKISELSDENTKLEGSCQSSSAEISALQKELRKKENECDQLNIRITATVERLEKVKVCLKTAEEKLGKQKSLLKDANEAITKLEKEKSGLNAKLVMHEEESKKEISSLVQQLDSKSTQLSEREAVMHEMEKGLEEKKMKELARKSELARDRDVAKAEAVQCKEEIALYRAQLAHSEESRQSVMQKLTAARSRITDISTDVQEKASKILAYEEKSKILKQELRESAKMLVVEKAALEKQMSNLEDKLNACEASKRLISGELTEARDRRDKLMSELNQAKKAKEKMARDLSASRRQLSELEKNYLEVKEQAERGEQRLAEKESKLASEKAQGKQREKTLQDQIKLLKSQLESADMAVAAAASSQDDNVRSESGTQTGCAASKETADDRNPELVADLKMQIEDLRTRLSMGAAAYTEKYRECHKLERKMKKIEHKPAPATTPKKIEEESATADSQNDFAAVQKPSGTKRKTSVESPAEPESSTGGKIMSKLEQFFMAIADPDLEEKERVDNLKLRLEEMEESVQFEHSRHIKYKQLYYEKKKSYKADQEKSAAEILKLNSDLDELKAAKEGLEHENDALKQQLIEFVNSSKDENVLKTREIVIPTANGVKSITRSCYPHDGGKLGSTYPHEGVEGVKDSSSDSDIGAEFHLANSRFASGLGLCPKNQPLDEKDPVSISRSGGDILAPSSSVIKRQPTRSPPMIEVISSGSDELPGSESTATIIQKKSPGKKSSRNRKSRGNRKNHKIA